MIESKSFKIGLKENMPQFLLLVLINAFVGGMIGIERSVLSSLGKDIFHVNAYTIVLSFVAAFGLTKALSNLAVTRLLKRISRKQLLIIGWLFALPVPFLLMFAENWNWIIVANIFLGINQGLSWSTTVIMKIDLAGPKNRGLAMGINEFAGYAAVGLASFAASSIAAQYGLTFYPFIPAIIFSVFGLLFSIFLVEDTKPFVMQEATQSTLPILNNIWKETSWKHINLGTVSINGFLNNMNDAVIWGLTPIFLTSKDFSLEQIGIIAGIYPLVWGVAQLFTGSLGDRYCKKQLIATGMAIQGLGLIILAISSLFLFSLLAAIIIGIGTALVYPNFLTTIAEYTHPIQRAQSLSIFRFWRDLGYVAGAIGAGWLADIFGLNYTFIIVGILTALGGLLAERRMCCTLKKFWNSGVCLENY